MRGGGAACPAGTGGASGRVALVTRGVGKAEAGRLPGTPAPLGPGGPFRDRVVGDALSPGQDPFQTFATSAPTARAGKHTRPPAERGASPGKVGGCRAVAAPVPSPQRLSCPQRLAGPPSLPGGPRTVPERVAARLRKQRCLRCSHLCAWASGGAQGPPRCRVLPAFAGPGPRAPGCAAGGSRRRLRVCKDDLVRGALSGRQVPAAAAE